MVKNYISKAGILHPIVEFVAHLPTVCRSFNLQMDFYFFLSRNINYQTKIGFFSTFEMSSMDEIVSADLNLISTSTIFSVFIGKCKWWFFVKSCTSCGL